MLAWKIPGEWDATTQCLWLEKRLDKAWRRPESMGLQGSDSTEQLSPHAQISLTHIHSAYTWLIRAPLAPCHLVTIFQIFCSSAVFGSSSASLIPLWCRVTSSPYRNVNRSDVCEFWVSVAKVDVLLFLYFPFSLEVKRNFDSLETYRS